MKKLIFLLVTVILAVFLLSSCGSEEETTTLYVYNWGEYIADGSEGSADVNALFEDYYYEKTGNRVEVNYSTFASNEDMYAKISSGAAAYDVIIPSDYMIERLIKEELIQPIYPAETLENFSNIKEEFRTQPYDPEGIYSVPYFYGMIGVIYNTSMVDESDPDFGTWDLMWSENYKGDILQYNNSRDAFGTAFYSLGNTNVNSTDEADWQAGLDKLLKQKSVVQGYVMDEIFNKMEGGSAAIASYYAGDYLSMYESNDELDFYYPPEGTNYYVDAMCVPTAAKHPDIAKAYIDFMLLGDTEIDGEEYNIAVENALMTYYASPNSVVYNDDYYFQYMEDLFTDEEREEGEEGIRRGAMSLLYPDEYPAGLSAKLEELGFSEEEYYDGITKEDFAKWTKPEATMYTNLDPKDLARLNAYWEKLKIESDIGTSIYVICGVIVACLAGTAIYFGVRRRKRAKYYE